LRFYASAVFARLLRLLRPVARHSALTATLITRLVPLATADHARLRDAQALRGPGAAPVGRAALTRRLVAGSLDRPRGAMPSDAGGTLAAVMLARQNTRRVGFGASRRWENGVAKRDFGASHPWPLIASSVHEPH